MQQSHLLHGRRDSDGAWPKVRDRILYDFMSKRRAPANDGVVAPTFADPAWMDEVARLPDAVETARRANDEAVSAAKTAEDKSSRVVQISLALLTITLALGAFQLTFVFSRSWVWAPTLIPVAIAFACLALAALEALQVERVGMYQQALPEDLAGIACRNPEAQLVAIEEAGRRLARWTANNKHTDLMQARAWFSRGLAALIIAGVLAGLLRATEQSSRRPISPTSTTTTPRRALGRSLGEPNG